MKSFSFANVRGIDLRIHPSFAFVFVWVVYHFGIAARGGIAGVAYGSVLMALVFLCVILHELGHALMAQEHEIRVRNITLFPFGGAAFIEQMPMKPRSEMLITIAGPAVNIAIAVALLPPVLLLGIFRGYASFSDYAASLGTTSPSGLLVYLLFANLMIFLFNLLPAFPMDGGRLIRAGLAALIGRERATGFAVALGMAAAVAMASIGLRYREFALPLVALFVIFAAYGEGKSVRLEAAMRRLQVGQFALWDSGGISEGHPLASALRGGPRDMAVTSNGRVVGMLWRRDVMAAMSSGSTHRTVGEVMDPTVVSVRIDDSVYDVQQQMQHLNRWAVPVVEDGQYRGIFTVDRFVHVYRQLNAQSPERRIAGMAASLGAVWRNSVN